MILAKQRTLTGVVVVVFVATNLLFIFLQIHKQSQFVKLSYSRQRLEKEQDQLNKQRNDLIHKIYLQQSRKNVKKYATSKLGMQDTSVQQIHNIDIVYETE